jgi:hypothetical protein
MLPQQTICILAVQLDLKHVLFPPPLFTLSRQVSFLSLTTKALRWREKSPKYFAFRILKNLKSDWQRDRWEGLNSQQMQRLPYKMP